MGCQWGSYAAPYGAEKAKMNALMAMIDSELALAGVTGVSVQVGGSSSSSSLLVTILPTSK